MSARHFFTKTKRPALISVVLTWSLVACHGPLPSKHQGADRPTSTPTLTSKPVYADSLVGVLDNTPEATIQGESEPAKKPGCPALSKQEIESHFAPHVHVAYKVEDSDSGKRVVCEVVPYQGTEMPRHGGVTIYAAKADPSSVSAPRPLRFSPGGIGLTGKDLFKGFTDTYPGFGAGSEGLGFAWLCGPYTFSIETMDKFDVFPVGTNPADSLSKVAEQRIKQLCGTTSQPSPHVMNEAHDSWLIYDARGGTSPSEYGISRPEGMPKAARVKDIQLTRDGRIAKPSEEGTP